MLFISMAGSKRAWIPVPERVCDYTDLSGRDHPKVFLLVIRHTLTERLLCLRPKIEEEVSQVTSFGVPESMIGYLFQCRYALLESLRRLRKSEDFMVSIETLDDVVFEAEGEPPELLQTKHHLNRSTDLNDFSKDLWKTIRIWAEGILNETIPEGSTFFLITTAQATQGSAAHYLKVDDESRNVEKAIERLEAVAESSTNIENMKGFVAFRSLNPDQKIKLVSSAFVIDGASSIIDLDAGLKESIFPAVDKEFISSFLQRLEGWWLQRAIRHLAKRDSEPILSEELYGEIMSMREQFKQENLPIDDDIFAAIVDESSYQGHVFVHLLLLIEIGNSRIFHAIRNYFRAFEQRSRWVREDLLLVGELSFYEDRLIEEWDLMFQIMREDLGDKATDEAMKAAARTLYKWVETHEHRSIRQGVTEPSIARGTYHMLADERRVGWHPEFVDRLKHCLEPQEVG